MGGISTNPNKASFSNVNISKFNLNNIMTRTYNSEASESETESDINTPEVVATQNAQPFYDSANSIRLEVLGLIAQFPDSYTIVNGCKQYSVVLSDLSSVTVIYNDSGNIDKIIDNRYGITYFYDSNGNYYASYFEYNKILVSFDSDGNIICQRYSYEDHKYNPISIYDLENDDIDQFGASQSPFYYNFYELMEDPLIYAELQKYYPEDSFDSIDEAMDFYERYFSVIEYTGCGYAGVTNMIFKEFEGREAEFEEKFGFPMYTIDEKGNLDFNYEVMMLMIFDFCNAGRGTIEQMEEGLDYANNIEDFFKPGISTSLDANDIEEFLAAYGLSANGREDYINFLLFADNNDGHNQRAQELSSDWEYLMYGGSGWNLYYPDGILADDRGGGHFMVIVGFVGDSQYRDVIGRNISDLRPYYELTNTDDYKKFSDNYNFKYQDIDYEKLYAYGFDLSLYWYDLFNRSDYEDVDLSIINEIDLLSLIEYVDSVKPDGVSLDAHISIYPSLVLAYEQYKNLTEEERMIYHYICSTEGKKAADEYLKLLEEWMNYPVVSSWGNIYILQIEGDNSSGMDFYRHYRTDIN